MMPPQMYHFRPATLDDLPRLAEWQAEPHVRAWWDADPPYDAAELSDPRVRRFIVSIDSHPFAFLQDYTVHGWGAHHFAHLPDGTRGIDQFIGDPEMIGRGHGTAMIGQRVQQLFDEGAPVVAVDPHPENARAIAVYRKLGFAVFGPAQETEWGLILPMKRESAKGGS
ncbi:GNAT family N-acetyltransferase [Paracoccaceae bacterium GXU_MW_L88]